MFYSSTITKPTLRGTQKNTHNNNWKVQPSRQRVRKQTSQGGGGTLGSAEQLPLSPPQTSGAGNHGKGP